MEEMTCRTICQFCYSGCGVIFHRDSNGRTTVKGDPEHPANRGQLCVKGLAIPEMLQGKNRLRHPLKRTKNGFEKISWDEALKIAADRLGEIRAAHGPFSLARVAGAPVSYHARDGFRQFMGQFGSPDFASPASLCMAPRMVAFHGVFGQTRAEADFERSRLVIFWGSNPLASERYGAFASFNGAKQIIPRLKKQGARMIAIDPFRSETVRQADEWVRINVGSDAALGLAMIHVIINEGLYDAPFVSEHTHGFKELAEHVRPFSPGWAEDITGMKADAIERLAREYATVKPASICDGNGLDMYTNAIDAVRCLAILMALTGNLDVPGGNVFLPFIRQPILPTQPVPKEKRIWYDTFPLFVEVPMIGLKEAILREEEHRPRAMIVHHSNPLLIHANESRTRQAFQKMDFLMVNDVVPTATSELADLVLPMATMTESHSYLAYASVEGGYLALSRPLAQPIGEARPVFEVEYELAERMGIHHDYPFHDTRSWLDFMLKSSGVTFERLQEEQIVFATPQVKYRKHAAERLNTPSGKVDLYSLTFEEKGYDPLPVYTPPAGGTLDSRNTRGKGFSLIGSSYRPGQFIHTRFKYLEGLSRLHPEPLVRIHPQDAVQRGIQDGDEVEVVSSRGRIAIRAKVEDHGSPGHVLVDFGWGNPTDGKASINALSDDSHFNPVSGATANRLFPCEVKKR